MADRPIIFSGPMVRALLDGRKTQTRRVLKPQPPEAPDPSCAPSNTPRHAAPYLDAYCGEKRTPANPRGMSRDWHWWQVDDRPGVCVTRAPCAPGDRLWVREAWRTHLYYDDLSPSQMSGEETIVFESDHPPIDRRPNRLADGRYRHSRFMPRWASRLTLTVTDVRVQRVQEISEADIAAEGITRGFSGAGHGEEGLYEDFADLWNSIHGPDAWDANPWVCAISFTAHRCNIDQMGQP